MKTDILTKALTSVQDTAKVIGPKLNNVKPELLFAGGVIAVGIGVVLACKGTLEVENEIDTTNEEVALVKSDKETLKDEYPNSTYRKDLSLAYIKGVLRIAKLYGPAAMFLLTGIACFGKGHSILKHDKLAALAAYSTLQDGFDKYRERVVNELGEEADKRFNTGTQASDKTISVKYQDEEGKTKTYKSKNPDFLPGGVLEGCSPYARLFAPETSDAATGNPYYDKMFLQNVERFANDARDNRPGCWYMLSELEKDLGFDPTDYIPTRSGKAHSRMEVGWIGHLGDERINLNIQEVYRDGKNGEPEIVYIIDPNVDGYILDELPGLGEMFKKHKELDHECQTRIERDSL